MDRRRAYFPLHSPRIAKIDRVKEGSSGRAKLYYLRSLASKSHPAEDERVSVVPGFHDKTCRLGTWPDLAFRPSGTVWKAIPCSRSWNSPRRTPLSSCVIMRWISVSFPPSITQG